MNEIILFLLTFICVQIIYKVMIVSKTRKAKKKGNKNGYEPLEITYLSNIYKINMKEVNYPKLLNITTFTSSFDIAVIITIVSLFKNFYLEVIFGFLSTISIILVSYHLIYLYYKKGGFKK